MSARFASICLALLAAGSWTAAFAAVQGQPATSAFDVAGHHVFVTQAACTSAFCAAKEDDCVTDCEAAAANDEQRALCGPACDAKASQCETCCSGGGAEGQCW